VGGRDAATLLERVFPRRIEDLAPGRFRYTLALDEAGYVIDDGLVLALGDGRFCLTTTTSGAERMEAWLRDWIDRLGLHVHLLDLTAALGAIAVAGPRARELLSRLTADPVGADALPAGGHAEIVVAGVRCRAIRSAFVDELAFELHHPRSRSVALWDALLEAGSDLGARPYGLEAMDVLRLERGHLYVGQDTLPDDHPGKPGLGWTVATDKPWFVGKVALERLAARPLERRLVGLVFEGEVPGRGTPLEVGGRIVGRVTSSARSPALGRGIGLGWVRRVDGAFPEELTAAGSRARVAPMPFLDPEGARLRA
jgi:sarcosine oxidase subunit alpha